MTARRAFSLALACLAPAWGTGLAACSAAASVTYAEGRRAGEALAETGAGLYSARASGLRVGPLTESGSITPDEFWPSAPRDDTFRRGMSDEPGEILVTRSIDTSDDGRVTIRVIGGSGVERETLADTTLALAESREILILANTANGITSTFSPAALFMPSELGAGDEINRAFEVESEGTMFGTGSGEGAVRLRGIGTQAVRTPAGDFVAFVVESTTEFAIGPARIRLENRAWLEIGSESGGLGMIAEEGRDTVRVFGITFRDVQRVSVIERIGRGAFPLR